MPTRIHLIRHAQGLHNVSAANCTLTDPALTAYGRRQCAKVAASLPPDSTIALLCASPLRRTLDTALLAFPNYVPSGGSIVAIPDAQEVGVWPCDHGRPLAVLEEEYTGRGVDLGLVHAGWERKEGRYGRETDRLEARAADLRRWLKAKSREMEGQGDVVLVTHGGLLHFLTQDWAGYDRFAGTGWANCEARTYEWVGDESDAAMRETTESRRRRERSTGLKPDRKEFIKLQKKRLVGKTGVVDEGVPVAAQKPSGAVLDRVAAKDVDLSKI